MTYLDSLKPNSKTIAKDAVAGFSTGLFSIPEGMAYAQLAGVNPVYGLYSGMVATIVAAMSTGTILMISTLTSAIALSTGSVLESAGLDASSDPTSLGGSLIEALDAADKRLAGRTATQAVESSEDDPES